MVVKDAVIMMINRVITPMMMMMMMTMMTMMMMMVMMLMMMKRRRRTYHVREYALHRKVRKPNGGKYEGQIDRKRGVIFSLCAKNTLLSLNLYVLFLFITTCLTLFSLSKYKI